MHKIMAMPLKRSDWITKVCKTLEGALGEYTKFKMAKLISLDNNWDEEVKSLLSKVSNYYMTKAKTSSSFDRVKAFLESILDAEGSQYQITSAKNEFIKLLTYDQLQEFRKKYKIEDFKSEDLLIEMLTEHLPELSKKLQTLG